MTGEQTVKTLRISVVSAILATAAVGIGLGQQEVVPTGGPGNVDPVDGAALLAPPADPPAPAEESPDPLALVGRLASESYHEREAATQELWDMGERGLEALRTAQDSQDPEVAYRARRLVRRIQTGITPDTPPEIVQLVEAYHRGDPDDKRIVMEALRKKAAYMQVLRLHRFEEDPLALEECSETVELVVIPAVQELLAKEDWDAARTTMSLVPRTSDNLRRRAAFSWFRGEIDEDMLIATRENDREFALALTRARGDIEGVLELAGELNREELVAGMSLFQGDPVPYFNWVADNHHFSATMRLNAEIARCRWLGDLGQAATYAKVLAAEARANEDDPKPMASLLLNGYWDQALPVMEGRTEHADRLYAYYEMVEQPAKAIAVYGYKGPADEKAAWIDGLMAKVSEKPAKATEERELLVTVGAFLVARGERELGLEIGRRLGRIMRKRGNQKDWLEFIGQLGDAAGVHYELAFAAAVDSMEKGNENIHAAQAIAAIFRNPEIAMRHWDRLKSEKDVPPRERLMLLGAIYGMVEMEPERVEPVLNRLFTKAVTALGDERRQALADLVEPAAYRDDANDVRELFVMLSEIDGIDRWSHLLGVYHSYMCDWESAAKAWEAELSRNPKGSQAMISLAATKIRMGARDEAAELLRVPRMNAFDEVDRLAQLAEVFSSYNISEDAESCLRRILMTADPTSRSWVAAGGEFAKYAKKRGEWRVAAAFMEVENLFDVRDQSTYISPLMYLRKRFEADFMRGLALHEEGREEDALALFDRSFQFLIGDGVLADDFFPLLREAGLADAHDRYFEISWERIMESIDSYPAAHNTYNSAAWLASRAVRRLDEAETLEAMALAVRPKQAAYLDTMAEVWFARGNREKAVEWSRKAVMDSENGGHSATGGSELRGQFERFKSDPFPVP